jgi:hypothetical protein
MNGKRRDMGLGSYPTVSLADARAKVAEARKLIAEGIDPITERDRLAALKAYQAANGVTFEQMAMDYIDSHTESWKNEKHRQQWEKYATHLCLSRDRPKVSTGHKHSRRAEGITAYLAR